IITVRQNWPVPALNPVAVAMPGVAKVHTAPALSPKASRCRYAAHGSCYKVRPRAAHTVVAMAVVVGVAQPPA
ncbi:hypothetical protein DVW31_16535, partial [Enterococcus faecium]